MTPRFETVVAGHLCLDIIPDLTGVSGKQFRELVLPGRLLQVGSATFCTGGAVPNTGLALAKLGIGTRLIGLVGDDPFGRAIMDIVRSHGAHLADYMVVDAGADTSYTIIISPKDTDRSFVHCPGTNDLFNARNVRDDVVARARLFHLGYPPLLKKMRENGGAQLVDVFRRAKKLGVTTSLDMAVFDPNSEAGSADWVKILNDVMPYVDVFLPNIEETLFTLRRETYDELQRASEGGDILDLVTPKLLTDLGRQVLEMGATIVGFKLGHRGLYVRTGAASAMADIGLAAPSDAPAWAGKELWAPCFQVAVMGTTGAGDSTVAGFLSALLRDLTLEQALTVAAAVGACNVEATDALSGVLPWDDTWRRIESGWKRHAVSISDPGWHFDALHNIWVGSAT